MSNHIAMITSDDSRARDATINRRRLEQLILNQLLF
jgi:hypothetical protein